MPHPLFQQVAFGRLSGTEEKQQREVTVGEEEGGKGITGHVGVLDSAVVGVGEGEEVSAYLSVQELPQQCELLQPQHKLPEQWLYRW